MNETFPYCSHLQDQSNAVGLNILSEEFTDIISPSRPPSAICRIHLPAIRERILNQRRKLCQNKGRTFSNEYFNHSSMYLHRDTSRAAGSKIFVGNIPAKTKTYDLWNHFTKFGEVIDCICPQTAKTSRRYAFVTFKTAREADAARKASPEELEFNGRTLNVQPAVPRNDMRIKLGTSSSARTQTTVDEEPITDECSVPAEGITINDLNDYCLLHIFSFLDFPKQVEIERVCKRWQVLSGHLWTKVKELPLQKMFPTFAFGNRLNDKVLRKLLQRCKRNITRLNFTTTANGLTDRSGYYIAKQCPKLEFLDASCTSLSRKSLTEIGKKCKMLKHFIHRNCNSSGEKAFWWLFHNARNLETVELSRCSRLSGKCFHHISSNLTSINLSNCLHLLSDGVILLAKNCPEMRELNLDHCPRMNEEALVTICSQMKKLEVFSLCGLCLFIPVEVGLHIAKLKELRVLRLFNSSLVTDTFIEAIANSCLKLENLDVGGTDNIFTGEGIVPLASMPCLRELHLNVTSHIGDGYIALTGSNTIEKLSLRTNRHVNDVIVEVLLSGLPLVFLDVGGCRSVTNQTLHFAIRHLTEKQNKELTLCLGETGCRPSSDDYPVIPPSLKLDYSFSFHEGLPEGLNQEIVMINYWHNGDEMAVDFAVAPYDNHDVDDYFDDYDDYYDEMDDDEFDGYDDDVDNWYDHEYFPWYEDGDSDFDMDNEVVFDGEVPPPAWVLNPDDGAAEVDANGDHNYVNQEVVEDDDYGSNNAAYGGDDDEDEEYWDEDTLPIRDLWEDEDLDADDHDDHDDHHVEEIDDIDLHTDNSDDNM